MSGADLRDAAIKGYSDVLKSLLQARSNPCSRDKMSLCALHYAAWNGHVECVKLLISNPFGVDGNGERASALNSSSCLGYNALHLVALDSPSHTAYEVTTLLLIAGLDQTAKDLEGKTAFQIAQEFDRSDVLRAMIDYNNVESMDRNGDDEVDPDIKSLQIVHDEIKDSLRTKYCFQVMGGGQKSVSIKDAGFDIPEFLLNYKKAAPLPPGMAIYEEHIKPLIEEGFYEMSGMKSYACLHFSRHQAKVNKERREALVLADPTRKDPMR
jgi:hypothetical protein